jgi:5-methylcytosine-specific restriction endonuclease McrA
MGRRGPGRSGRAWDQLKARVFAEETHCWLCHRFVDQTLPPRTAQSRSVDHVVPLAQGGDPLDRRNCRLAHLSCNGRRGKNLPSQPSSGATRRW